jgi:crossover junction endodeoxyribonuclease RuvC
VRWLGVDPGSRHCGWGVIEQEGSRLQAVAWGRISPPAGTELPSRLALVAAGIEAAVTAHAPAAAAVECIYHGISSRSLIVLAEARGVVLATLCRLGLAVDELSPAEVKSAITGSGRADKQQVARMVRLLLGLAAAPLAEDAADALAVALARAQRAGYEGRLRISG